MNGDIVSATALHTVACCSTVHFVSTAYTRLQEDEWRYREPDGCAPSLEARPLFRDTTYTMTRGRTSIRARSFRAACTVAHREKADARALWGAGPQWECSPATSRGKAVVELTDKLESAFIVEHHADLFAHFTDGGCKVLQQQSLAIYARNAFARDENGSVA